MNHKIFTLDELHTKTNGRVVAKTCIYDKNSPAVHTCYGCGVGLCKICGCYDDDKIYCNKCYEELAGRCPECDNELEPIYENNGADEAGARHDEIVGYKPCDCRGGEL